MREVDEAKGDATNRALRTSLALALPRDPARESSRVMPPEVAEAFSQFSPVAAITLGRLAVLQRWRSGDRVVGRDSSSPVVIALARGRLRLTAASPEGNEIFSGWLLPGGVLGLVSAITACPWPIAAMAEGNCETHQIDASTLRELAQSDALIAMDVACILGRQALGMMTLSIARMERTLTGRVHAVLKHFAVLIGRPAGVGAWVLAVSQCDVASAVGASRARVNIELRALERAGRIGLGYRRIVLFDDLP